MNLMLLANEKPENWPQFIQNVTDATLVIENVQCPQPEVLFNIPFSTVNGHTIV
jgi:hypothetical protein